MSNDNAEQIIKDFTDTNNLKELIFQALGEASMCWSETPLGVFDSTRAKAIGDRVVDSLTTAFLRLKDCEHGRGMLHYCGKCGRQDTCKP